MREVKRRAQTAIEYLLMLAMALILVAIALKAVVDTSKSLGESISNYTSVVRDRVIGNL
ncbi:class III signal peptide-containing protein [Thermococcus sp.]